MKNFAKSILNYFATYTETRFRFATKRLAYQWADDQHHALDVLDFGVFPDVQARILDCVAANKPINISVQKGEYAIRLNGRPVAERLLAYVNEDGSVAALESLLRDYGFYLEDKGKEATDLFDLPVDRRKAWMESCRQYNLRLRKEYARRLLDLQQTKLDEIRASLRLINAFPRVSLNARQEEQKFFDCLQQVATEYSRAEAYVAAVHRCIRERAAREKVICVISKAGDADYKQKLDQIEETDPAKVGGKVEFIFAVNKLSEGWDVDNVFQIIPMEERVFNSKLLISQVLGRGLRLPRKVSFVQIKQNYPVVTVTNHERFAEHIQELLNQVTDCETRFISAALTDAAQERARHNFSVFNLEYVPSTRIEERTPEERESEPGQRTLTLTPCGDRLGVTVTYLEGKKEFQLTRDFCTFDAVVYDLERRFRNTTFESQRFDFGNGFVCDRVPGREEIERVIRTAMQRAGISGDRLSVENKQQVDIFFNAYLPKGTGKVIRENVEGQLVGIATAGMHRSSTRAGGLEQEVSVFLTEDHERELDKQNQFVLKEVTRRPRQMELGQDAWLPSQEGFNRDYIRQMVALKHLYAVNTSLFRTPQELVILSHEPERLFLFRLIEHGRLVDSWIKAPDTEFYSVDYEYWRHGRDRVRRSFNPDFFIRLDIGHYLSRLPADAVVTGATRLRELQNEGIEQLMLVVEIKSDDDNTDETRAKEAFAKEHFAAMNRRLRDTQEVDVAEPFRNSVRQHYLFSLLRPRDYPGWFSRLKNGLVAAG